MTRLECQEVFARLSEFIDGELPAELVADLSLHISDCAPCIEFVESLRKSKTLCKGLQPGEQPGELAPDVRERMREALRRCLAERS
jgi:anti-sigma factor RsiW